MRRALLVALLAAASALGQSPVLIQNLLMSGQAVVASADVNNVGQIGHSAYLTFTNAPSHTCTTPAATAQLEYSFDNSTFTAFGSPQASTTVGSGQTYIGQGGFGYIRFNLTAFDTTNCRATVWYVGTSAPLAIQLSGPNGIGSIITCSNSATATVTAMGSGVTILAKPSSGQVHICGYYVSNPSGTAQQISFGYGTTTGLGCLGTGQSEAGTGTDLRTFSVSNGQTVQIGSSSLGQIDLVPAGNNVCGYTGGANSLVATAFYSVF